MVIGLNEQEGSANAVSGPDRHTTAESGVVEPCTSGVVQNFLLWKRGEKASKE